MLLWVLIEDWQRASGNYLGEINSKYPKSKCLQFIKTTNWILPWILKGMPIPEASIFYSDANKLGMVDFKSDQKKKKKKIKKKTQKSK